MEGKNAFSRGTEFEFEIATPEKCRFPLSASRLRKCFLWPKQHARKTIGDYRYNACNFAES